MTTELTLLGWTLVLALVQILLFDIARTSQYGAKWNMGARDGAMPPLSAVAERLKRAQDNLFETLPLFIAAVLIAHVADRNSALTTLAGCGNSQNIRWNFPRGPRRYRFDRDFTAFSEEFCPCGPIFHGVRA